MDLSPYLQNIISETLRVNPVAPVLVPHESSHDCTVGGYLIPRGTMLLVNAWVMQKDPETWEDPLAFRPERFENEEKAVHKLILSFGLGRRACPGVPLAQRVVGLTLGTLTQYFEWTRMSEEEIDMTEGRGITMPKLVRLEAMCKARAVITRIYSSPSLCSLV
ncbi:hypothetical protein MLD38_005089 [Melastoma candidum]|uniref:Uncharacterized protein n=1 Tax=Melastoma candidum TaxID=119954 RepID=A0ACB9SBN1_9MYRT|nr:hypothetical protein MLD38_005089 [Melastoma candidum]